MRCMSCIFRIDTGTVFRQNPQQRLERPTSDSAGLSIGLQLPDDLLGSEEQQDDKQYHGHFHGSHYQRFLPLKG
jgi:hypothetical protein